MCVTSSERRHKERRFEDASNVFGNCSRLGVRILLENDTFSALVNIFVKILTGRSTWDLSCARAVCTGVTVILLYLSTFADEWIWIGFYFVEIISYISKCCKQILVLIFKSSWIRSLNIKTINSMRSRVDKYWINNIYLANCEC